MNQPSQLSAWFLLVPHRLFRRAWLLTVAGVATIVILQRLGIVFPLLFLILLASVAASGALGGLVSGLISGLLMTATVLYFWSLGLGPEPLTGNLLRAFLGSGVALATGSYLGLMRERIMALITELEARQLDLEKMNSELSHRVAERTSQLQLVSDRLRESQHRLVKVARRWIETEEIERRNLARDLHNDIGQGLTALHLNLETSKKSVADVPRLQEFVTTARDLINQVTDSVRQLSWELRPMLLDDLGLIAAVRELASRQFETADIAYDLQHHGDDAVIDENIRIVAYRLVQEAIKNLLNHADASHVNISIHVGDAMLEIHVTDDGKGFDLDSANSKSRHFGLISMRERAGMMGGSCEIRSEPGKGTDVTIVLPLVTAEVAA